MCKVGLFQNLVPAFEVNETGANIKQDDPLLLVEHILRLKHRLDADVGHRFADRRL